MYLGLIIQVFGIVIKLFGFNNKYLGLVLHVFGISNADIWD